jgi:hypothetical protein
MKKSHDLLGLLRTRGDRPDGGAPVSGAGRGRSQRSGRTTAPAPASSLPEAFSSTRSRFAFATEWLEKLQEHVVLSKGFLVACGTLLLFLCFAFYLVGFKRGEYRGRETLLAQEDGAAGAGPAPKESPLDVRVPKTMQGAGPNPAIGQLLGDQAAREAAATKEQDGTQSDPQKAAPPKTCALRLITYKDDATGNARAQDMWRFLGSHEIAEVKLVKTEKDGMLSVLVLLADDSKATADAMRARVRALPPPPFDKNFDFKKQPLSSYSVSR